MTYDTHHMQIAISISFKDSTPRNGAYKMKFRKQVKLQINYAKGNNNGHLII